MSGFTSGFADFYMGWFAGVVNVFDVSGFVGAVAAVVFGRFDSTRCHGRSCHMVVTAAGHDVRHALRKGGGQMVVSESGSFLGLIRR